jgi:hypothetical protein
MQSSDVLAKAQSAGAVVGQPPCATASFITP